MEFHELANVFPMLAQVELEALAADIQAFGLRHDITTYQGKILDGRNRYAACVLADVDPRFTEYTGDNPIGFVISENIARRHLDESQRAMCAARLATMKQGARTDLRSIDLRSQPQAAELLNVSVPSVKRAAQVIAQGVPELVQAVDRGEIAVSRAAQIAREPEAVQREAIKTPHVSHNSGNNEWYTPPEYIEAAREVMGTIDLDPASSEIANKIVKAKRFYTADNSGLEKKWKGRVWMNPPYSSELIGQFTAKLCDHVRSGDITEAVVLVNNATEAAWFEDMADLASTVMFTFSRVKFLDAELSPRGAPLQGQAVLYFGQNYKAFIKSYSKLAWAVNHGKH
jgi:ParB family chromosome partitioning protein